MIQFPELVSSTANIRSQNKKKKKTKSVLTAINSISGET
jgi:hypothetical protein